MILIILWFLCWFGLSGFFAIKACLNVLKEKPFVKEIMTSIILFIIFITLAM